MEIEPKDYHDQHVSAILITDYSEDTPIENQLINIPESIYNLSHLESLLITGQNITHIPNTIAKCPNLKQLLLSIASTTIPQWIFHLPNLESLDLTFSKVKNFNPPKRMASDAFTFIRLNYLQLTEVPEFIFHLPNLTWLDLAHNQLETLPDLSTLSHLENIVLNHNRFTTVPEAVITHPTLIDVDMESNFLKKIPASLLSHPILKHFNFNWNFIEQYQDCGPFIAKYRKNNVYCQPFLTLHGFPAEKINRMLWDEMNLPSYALTLIENRDWDGIRAYYAQSLTELLHHLRKNGRLSEIMMERLIHEATYEHRTILESFLPSTHPVMIALASKFCMEAPKNQSLFL